MFDTILCQMPKYCRNCPLSTCFCLFVLSVISSVEGRRGRGRRRRIFPLPALFIRLRGGLDLHKDDIDPDLFDAFEIDEEIGFPPSKALSAGDDDALHSSLRPSENHIANLAELFPIDKVDRFLSLQFNKTCFHTSIVCGKCRNVSAGQEISFLTLASAFFSRRETCA